MSHPLVVRLHDADPAVRAGACREIATDPAAVLLLEPLAEALGDPTRTVARAASDALVALSPLYAEVDALLRRTLRSDDPRRRFGAAMTKARLGPPDAGLLPTVVEALGASDPDTRWAAARILVDLARAGGEALPVVLGLARAADSAVVRRMAVFCLRELADQDEAIAQALTGASGDPDPAVRSAALTSFASLHAAPRFVVERLLEVLRDDRDPTARQLAVLALGELASHGAAGAARACEALEHCRRSERDPRLREAATRALARAAGGAPTQNTSASSE